MPRKKPLKAIAPTRESSAMRVTPPAPQLEALASELYSVFCRGLTLYGLSVDRQRKLLKKALIQPNTIKSVSVPLLDQFRSMSDLLTEWLQELPYIDAAGRPKVLPIRGRGATFESLARQFLPEHSVEEAVALACHSATVGILPGGRIAVYGDPMVNVVDNPEVALAQTICHITNIIKTAEANLDAARRQAIPGRLERLVHHNLSPTQFEIFRKSIRPQLNSLCEHADRVLKTLAKKKSRDQRKTYGAGIGLYVFLNDDAKGPSRGRRASTSRAARAR